MKVTKKCQALDINGKNCGCKTGLKKYAYHGDPMIVEREIENTWVEVYLCRKHQGVLSPMYVIPTFKNHK